MFEYNEVFDKFGAHHITIIRSEYQTESESGQDGEVNGDYWSKEPCFQYSIKTRQLVNYDIHNTSDAEKKSNSPSKQKKKCVKTDVTKTKAQRSKCHCNSCTSVPLNNSSSSSSSSSLSSSVLNSVLSSNHPSARFAPSSAVTDGLPVRQYYHSRTGVPMAPQEIFHDSDG